MNVHKPMRIILPLAKKPPAIVRQRSEKSDMEDHGAGLVMSRAHGEQLLMMCPDGSVVVITAIKGTDGRAKLGVRCGIEYDVKRREVSPQEWIDEVERAAAAR